MSSTVLERLDSTLTQKVIMRQRPFTQHSESERFSWFHLFVCPELFFLSVAIPIGIVLIFLTPPIQSPDEDYHFYRAYQISEGQLIAVKQGDETGGNLPASLARFNSQFSHIPFFRDQKTNRAEILETCSIQLDLSDCRFLGYSAIAVQPPLGHVPQALGLLIARQFTSSVLVCMYVARFFNLCAMVGLVFLAIRRTPIGQWGFTALALTPMSMFLTASLNSDALTNSLAFLLLAQIFRCAFGLEERVTTGNVWLMAGLGIAVGGLIKQAYFPLAFCYLLIPISKLGSVRRYLTGFGIVVGATLLSTAVWGFIVRDIYSPARIWQGINPREHLQLILSDPGAFVMTLFWTVYYQFRTKTKEFIGILGWLDLSLPSKARTLEWACLAVFFLAEFKPRAKLRGRQVLLALGVVSLITLMILVALHITWNPVGFPYVRFQGRYFIPIGPLLGLAFSQIGGWLPPAVNKLSPRVRPLAVVYLPCFLLVALACVYDRYYIDTPQAATSRRIAFALTRLEEGETLEAARPGLQEVLEQTPDGKNFNNQRALVGSLLDARNSRDFVDRIHSHPSRLSEKDVNLCVVLGKILTADGNYSEALASFEKAKRLSPGNENGPFWTWGVRALTSRLKNINQTITTQVQSDMLDRCQTGTEQEEVFLRPRQGTVPQKDSPAFVWRTLPPSGERICFRPSLAAPQESRQAPYYACAAMTNPLNYTPSMDKPFPLYVGKRIFVFPPPLNAIMLNDEQVSWYFQRRMIDLTEEEVERELVYRQEHQFEFPLTALPE